MDKDICWYQDKCVAEMNRFYDTHKNNEETSRHFKYFSELLGSTDEKDVDILDVGCGTGMLSEYCNGLIYSGIDLPHILTGCSMRNYPNYFYKPCDILTDDLKWINSYPIIALNAVVDVMQNPLELIEKILQSASKWVIIHRQEFSEDKTSVSKNESYGSWTYHSKINKLEFKNLCDKYSFDIKKELTLEYTNWEGNGNSVLLRKRKSFSLSNIDYKLNEFMGDIEDGKFIEVGANDGISQSNTLYFEQYKNWTGVLIEPIRKDFEHCIINRSPRNNYVNAALVPDELNGTDLELNYMGLMTSVTPFHNSTPFKVKGYSLNTILDIIGIYRFDLMVMDIEGYEPEVLRTFDFDKFRIEYLLIEERKRSELLSKVLAKHYREVCLLSEHDYLYKRC